MLSALYSFWHLHTNIQPGARRPWILPDETIIDGEVVALDASGRPPFNALQNHGAEKAALSFYVFDVLVLAGQDVMREPLATRRALLDEHIVPTLIEPIRLSPVL